jgi:hypothetical protein
MGDRVNTHFLKLIEKGKHRGEKMSASFHTLHTFMKSRSGENSLSSSDYFLAYPMGFLPVGKA